MDSYKGRLYHSLALDEAQECIVNIKIKQLLDHLVEMADFMAYLDAVVTGLDSHVFEMKKDKVVNKKQYCTRKNLIFDLADKHIFKLHEKRALCNIFLDNPPLLASANTQDLLSI